MTYRCQWRWCVFRSCVRCCWGLIHLEMIYGVLMGIVFTSNVWGANKLCVTHYKGWVRTTSWANHPFLGPRYTRQLSWTLLPIILLCNTYVCNIIYLEQGADVQFPKMFALNYSLFTLRKPLSSFILNGEVFLEWLWQAYFYRNYCSRQCVFMLSSMLPIDVHLLGQRW